MSCRRSVVAATASNVDAFTRPLNRATPDWDLMRFSIEAGITHHADGSPILHAAGMSESQRQAAYDAMCAIADAMNTAAERRGELSTAVQSVVCAFDIDV